MLISFLHWTKFKYDNTIYLQLDLWTEPKTVKQQIKHKCYQKRKIGITETKFTPTFMCGYFLDGILFFTREKSRPFNSCSVIFIVID